jgi:type II secretory pathway pseudopilin PulG
MRRGGHTLLELTAGLALLSIMVSLGAARWRHAVDLLAVTSAREALVRELHWARAMAPLAGGAWVEIVPDSGLVRAGTGERREGGDPGLRETRLGERWGVALTAGTTPRVVLRFDDLGLGVAASRSFTLSRGSRMRGLALSAYGRVRRW